MALTTKQIKARYESAKSRVKSAILDKKGLPTFLTARSGSGKTELIYSAYAELNINKFLHITPDSTGGYFQTVCKSLKNLLAKHGQEIFDKYYIFIDESQLLVESGFNVESIQPQKRTIKFEDISIPYGKIIFAGHSNMFSSESERARLNLIELPEPNREFIYELLSESGNFPNSKALNKAIEFSPCNMHRVRALYSDIENGTIHRINPLGLSDLAIEILKRVDGERKIRSILGELGIKPGRDWNNIEKELLTEKLIESDKYGVRFLTQLGYKIVKQRALRLPLKSLMAKPKAEPEPEPELVKP